MERERGHVRPESNFGRGRVQKFRKNLARVLESSIRFRARWISPMRVCVVVIEVVAHLFDDVPGHLSSSGTIEIGDPVAVVYPFKSRELVSDFSHWCDGLLLT